MNVIKKIYILIILVLITTSIYSDDTFNYNISLGISLEYGNDTFDGGDFKWKPILNAKIYFLKDLKEITIGDNGGEYEGEFKPEIKKKIIVKSALFLDSLIKLKFSDSYEYGGFLEEEKSFFDVYLGLGYLRYIKKSLYISFFGGGNFYKEDSIKSFNTDNSSPDIVMDYQEKKDSFTDYGFYLGIETIFFMPKKELDNLFSFGISFVYSYKMMLREYTLLSELSIGFNF